MSRVSEDAQREVRLQRLGPADRDQLLHTTDVISPSNAARAGKLGEELADLEDHDRREDLVVRARLIGLGGESLVETSQSSGVGLTGFWKYAPVVVSAAKLHQTKCV